MLIIPNSIIKKARIAAINFHPGPPEYPGRGCLNFALHENSKFYGVTSHFMTSKVDDGIIIECRRFPIQKLDTVNSLLDRTHTKLLDLFYDVTSGIALTSVRYLKESIQKSKNEKWSEKKFKIKDLENLSVVDMGINKESLIKLIRATYTEKFPPKIILHDFEFILKPPKNR